MLLFVYNTTRKGFVIFTCRYFWVNHLETVQIRTIATTATNMLECNKGANFSIVCTYF